PGNCGIHRQSPAIRHVARSVVAVGARHRQRRGNRYGGAIELRPPPRHHRTYRVGGCWWACHHVSLRQIVTSRSRDRLRAAAGGSPTGGRRRERARQRQGHPRLVPAGRQGPGGSAHGGVVPLVEARPRRHPKPMIERTTVLTPDCRLEPYWWRATPHDPGQAGIIPASADVAIVGSGITGLVAATHLARA